MLGVVAAAYLRCADATTQPLLNLLLGCLDIFELRFIRLPIGFDDHVQAARDNVSEIEQADALCNQPLAPFGRNKNGRAYKRQCGAYKQSLRPLMPAVPPLAPAIHELSSKVVSDLRNAIDSLKDQLARANEQIATLTAQEGHLAKEERLKGEAIKHEEYHKAFMAGLEKGLEMATGQYRAPASAAGAASSSSR